MELGVVRHRTGTAGIEDGQVVIRLTGTKGGLRERGKPWEQTIRIPVEVATATVEGSELTVRRDGRAVQALVGCRYEEIEAFLTALDQARRASAAVRAECGHCGAPAQVVGRPCAYCTTTVA